MNTEVKERLSDLQYEVIRRTHRIEALCNAVFRMTMDNDPDRPDRLDLGSKVMELTEMAEEIAHELADYVESEHRAIVADVDAASTTGDIDRAT